MPCEGTKILGVCSAKDVQYLLKSDKAKTNLQSSFYLQDQWISQGKRSDYCTEYDPTILHVEHQV